MRDGKGEWRGGGEQDRGGKGGRGGVKREHPWAGRLKRAQVGLGRISWLGSSGGPELQSAFIPCVSGSCAAADTGVFAWLGDR